MSDPAGGQLGPADVFDWELAPVTMQQAVAELRRPTAAPRLVMTVNVAMMWMADRDPRLARIVESAALRVADGMGVMWTWRLLGRRLPERVAGIDLMEQLVAAAADDGRSVYLLGARSHVLDRTRDELLRRHPNLRIAGVRDGYFAPDEHDAVVASVRNSGADLLFLGMPSPLKEHFAADHLEDFGADLVMGVGGSFDVIAGVVPRAPGLLQRIGLEWAWRLACEPRRMWRRYAVTNVWVARRLLARGLTRRHRGHHAAHAA